jgi:hypothetical protein
LLRKRSANIRIAVNRLEPVGCGNSEGEQDNPDARKQYDNGNAYDIVLAENGARINQDVSPMEQVA